MPVRTAYAGAAVAGEVLTAANVNKLPGGWLGYAEVTADQGGIVAEVGVTGLSVVVTVGSARRIRVSYIGQSATTASGDVTATFIREGAAYLQSATLTLPNASAHTISAYCILTPTAGSHTYSITTQRLVGSGSITHKAGATNPASILVEDIGPAT